MTTTAATYAAFAARPTYDSAVLLHHAEVKAVIARIVGRFLHTQDVEDGIGDVQLKVLGWQRRSPGTFWAKDLAGYKIVAATAAKSYLVSRYRRKLLQDSFDAGLVVHDADAQASRVLDPAALEPADAKKALVLFAEDVEKSKHPEMIAEIFNRLLAGEDQAEIARNMCLSHQQVRDRVREIRKRFGKKKVGLLGTFGAGTAFAVGLFALRWMSGAYTVAEPTGVAYVNHRHEQQVFVEMTAVQQAKDIRESARFACRSFEWSECLDLLDRAAVIDPEGDRAPEVQAARDTATKIIDDEIRTANAKHGGR
jgi:hypothetical protein